MMLRAQLQLLPALVIHLVPFLTAAMLCHGLLAKERPSARHLTEFYFWLAFGGMVGGLFNTLAAPVRASRSVEDPLALAAVSFLRPADPRAPAAVDRRVAAGGGGGRGAAVLFALEGDTLPTLVAASPPAPVSRPRRDQATLAPWPARFGRLARSRWRVKPNCTPSAPSSAHRISFEPGGGPTCRTAAAARQAGRPAGAPPRTATYYHRTGPFGL